MLFYRVTWYGSARKDLMKAKVTWYCVAYAYVTIPLDCPIVIEIKIK